MPDTKVSFPHLGSYCIPIEYLFTRGLEVDYITPPPITRRTLEIGSRYSPDFVCSPFKYNLGNFIETIEAGANTLVQTGGVCRLGYYGELHEQILRDLGYQVKFVNMARASYANPASFYSEFRDINPDMSIKKVARVLTLVLRMVELIDEFENVMRNQVGFEREEGSFDRLHTEFLSAMREVEDHRELSALGRLYMRRLKNLPVDRPKNPLRVGIIGEYYTIMEPYSNHFMEKELARMGIAVDRWMNISNTILHNRPKRSSPTSATTPNTTWGRRPCIPSTRRWSSPKRSTTASSTSNPSAARRRSTPCRCCKTSATTTRSPFCISALIHRPARRASRPGWKRFTT